MKTNADVLCRFIGALENERLLTKEMMECMITVLVGLRIIVIKLLFYIKLPGGWEGVIALYGLVVYRGWID